MRLLAKRAEAVAPHDLLWQGRRNVFFVDGTTFNMADTEKNQELYPQPKDQAEGCGFPKMRAVALISFTTGMVIDIEYAAYSGKATGEMSLLRKLIDRMPDGSLIVGDKLYCGFFLFASLLKSNKHATISLTTERLKTLDDAKVRQLRNGDWIIKWDRPRDKPDWMSKEEYEEYPEMIELRLVTSKVKKGNGISTFYTVTSLMDIELYPSDAVEDTGDKRWYIETDFRSIKTTMGLEMLRAKSPHMVHLELLFGLFAYNLIRSLAFRCALKHELCPRKISFTATMTTLLGFFPKSYLALVCKILLTKLIEYDLEYLSQAVLPHQERPNEPRVKKERDSKFKKLTKPRRDYKIHPDDNCGGSVDNNIKNSNSMVSNNSSKT
jgi:hypothetical protein